MGKNSHQFDRKTTYSTHTMLPFTPPQCLKMARLFVTMIRKLQRQQQTATTTKRIKSLDRFCPMLPFLLLCFLCVVATAQGPLDKSNYNNKQNQRAPIRLLLTVSPSAFTEPIIRGFNESCHKQQDTRVSCFVRTQLVRCPDIHAALKDLQTMLATDFYAGLEGLAVNTDCNTQPYTGFLKELTQQKDLSLLTYGRDLPAAETGRFAFVASDNGFMGRTVARLLRQLHPEGGTYAVVGHMKVRTEAFQAEIEKYNHLPGYVGGVIVVIHYKIIIYSLLTNNSIIAPFYNKFKMQTSPLECHCTS